MQFNVDYLGRLQMKLMRKTWEGLLRDIEIRDSGGIKGRVSGSSNTPATNTATRGRLTVNEVGWPYATL
jgi:hypothetical protein